MSGVREALTRYQSCVHFTGMQHERCEAGVRYLDVRVLHEPIPLPGNRQSMRASFPCLLKENHGGATCSKLQAPTNEQLEAEIANVERIFAAVDAGKSPCCDAPLDERAMVVARDGKRVGPRYCSKCGKFVDRSCSPEMPGDGDEVGDRPS